MSERSDEWHEAMLERLVDVVEDYKVNDFSVNGIRTYILHVYDNTHVLADVLRYIADDLEAYGLVADVVHEDTMEAKGH